MTLSSNRDDRYYERVGRAKTPRRLEAEFARDRCEIGDRVSFKSGSAPGGVRSGRVIKWGHLRATVAYAFYNGREAEKSVRYEALIRRHN